MAKGSIDRRVARTRALLHETLMSLMLKKDYEAITIRDICDAANIGRSTFYAHYTSKDELMRSGLDNLRRALVTRQRDALATPGDVRAQSLSFSLTLFAHARDHMSLHPTLVAGGAVALGAIRQMISDLVRNELTTLISRNSEDAIPRELIVQYVVGAYMSVLTWWLDGKSKLPAEQVDAMFRRLVVEGIAPLHAGSRVPPEATR